MKLKRALILLPLLTLTISGCSFLQLVNYSEDGGWWFNNSSTQANVDFNDSSIKTVELQSKQMKYTYNDFTKYNYYYIDSMPSVGNPKILVMPLWFKDSNLCIASYEKESVRNDIEKAFFSENTTDTGWYSVKQYYKEESHGLCNIDGEVTDWISLENNHRYYDELDSDSLNDFMGNLINSEIEKWKATKTEAEFKSFDSDGNGYLDGVVLIYGYKNSSNSIRRSTTGNLWAWTYWLQDENKDKNNPIPNSYSFMSYDFMYESTFHGIKIDTHTYIHEMGHMFGLQDYYDYNDQSTANPAGAFSMQDYNVGGHDPYSMLSLGWTTNYIPTESCNIILHPFESSGEVILLKNTLTDSPFDEYLLLEMYSPTGVNDHDSYYPYQGNHAQGPRTVGIRLWHVDARLIQPENQAGTKYSSAAITTNFDHFTNGYEHLNTNTTYGRGYESYCSPLPSCYNYKLLQLIRSDDTEGSKMSQDLSASNMFTSGSEFIFKDYTTYFTNSGKLNDGSNFGWNFKVNAITNNAASITLVKI